MEVLDWVFLGNTLRAWAMGLLSGAGTLLVLLLARRILVARLGKLAARTTNRLDDLVVELIRRTRTLFLATLALWPAQAALSLSPRALEVVHVVTVIALAIQAGIWGTVAIAQALGGRARDLREQDPAAATTLTAVTVLLRLVLWALLLLLALDNLGFNVSTLVAGLGIGGVAVALATQNVLSDILASLSIVLDKPFVVGDFIIVGDLMGSVEYVGLKTTRVRSLWGEQIIFSNADLLGSRIRNYKRMAERRVVFKIGVTYQTTHAQLGKLGGMLKEIVSSVDGTRFDRAHFATYDDSSLGFEVVYYVLTPDYNRYMDIQQQINLAIYQRFAQEGVEFAYPTRTLFLESADGAQDPDGTGDRGGRLQLSK
jgi:small-conductance mechanosensitive channel